MTTNTTAPASSPRPARTAPPRWKASSNSSNDSAEIRAPLANASSTPVTCLGGLKRVPIADPMISALDAASP